MYKYIILFVLILAQSCSSGGDEGGDGNLDSKSLPISITLISSLPELIHLGPAIKLSNGKILLGGAYDSSAGVLLSADNGMTWGAFSSISAGGSGDPVMGLSQLDNGSIFAITNRSDSVFTSNDGDNWVSILGTSGIMTAGSKLDSIGNRLYLIAGTSILYSDDNGTTWNVITTINEYSSSIDVTPSGIVAVGCCSGGPSEMTISFIDNSDLSSNEISLNSNDLVDRPRAVIEKGNGSLLMISGSGAFKETNDLQTINDVTSPIQSDEFVHSALKTSTGDIVISTMDKNTTVGYLYLSKDNGDSFERFNFDGKYFSQMLEVSSNLLLGFEMISYDGNHPTNVYAIQLSQ